MYIQHLDNLKMNKDISKNCFYLNYLNGVIE